MSTLRTAALLAAMTAIFMAVGYAIGGSSGMTIAFLIAAAMNFLSCWNGDKMVLRMHRAVEIGPDNAPEFHEIVRRLSEAADLPMPKTYIIDSPQPNAFATGRNPQNAAVAATTGLLDSLSPEEVAGVMAHELAHIANRDTLTMTITATLAGAISMLGNFAFFMGGNRGNNQAGALGTLLAIIIAPFAAMMVQMAISRTREYSADRLGAQICGRPLWLASALDKIARGAARIPNRLAEQNPATAHLFIINPLGLHARDSLFSTHPNTDNRIAALREMALSMDAQAEEAAHGDDPVTTSADESEPELERQETPGRRQNPSEAGSRTSPSEPEQPASGRDSGNVWGRQPKDQPDPQPGQDQRTSRKGPWD